MIDPRHVELMNLSCDGAIDAAGRAELETFLQDNPHGRRYYEELRRVIARMEAEGHVEPPAELHERVMNAIRPLSHMTADGPSVERAGESHGLAGWLRGMTFGPRLAYASFFAVGLLFGAFLYGVTSYDGARSGSLDLSKLYGTMGITPEAASFHQTSSTSISEDRVTGEVRIHESDRTVLADITLSSTRPVDWVVRFDPASMTFAGFRRIDGADGGVVATSRELRVTHSGDNRYVLIFTNSENQPVSPVTVEIYDGNALLFTESMAVTGD